jgi:hypothetical protein
MVGPDLTSGAFRVSRSPVKMNVTWPAETALQLFLTTRADIGPDVAADVIDGISSMLRADAARDAEELEREVAAHGGGGFGGRVRGDA